MAAAPLLPPQTGPRRKTLVLDLDLTLIETLVLRQAGDGPPDFVYTDSVGVRAQVWQRPHLQRFLAAASQDFEVVLFTAAGQRHADAVLSHVDPHREYISHRLYLQHTRPTPTWAWVKDLSQLGRPLSQTLIVDDCEAGVMPRENWVSIAPFSQASRGWRNDDALLAILAFLRQKVLPADDVRDVIRKHYDLVKCIPVGLSPMLDGWVDDVSHLPRDDQTPAACTTDNAGITDACGGCQAAAKGKACGGSGVSGDGDGLQGMGSEAVDPFVPTPSMPILLSQSCRSS